MQYAILNYTASSDYPTAEDVEQAKENELWGAYTRALIESGILVAGNALHPAHTATTLRVRGNERDIQDGPYAASKEQLGGFYIIDVPDLDEALRWASRNPAASSGAVEVRPVAMSNNE